jgi:hypothetical protein
MRPRRLRDVLIVGVLFAAMVAGMVLFKGTPSWLIDLAALAIAMVGIRLLDLGRRLFAAARGSSGGKTES